MEGGFGDVVLAAEVFDRLIFFGLPYNADDFFGTVLLLLHQTTP